MDSIQAQDLCKYQKYPRSHVTKPSFILGLFLFLCGFVINNHSDSILRNLKRKGKGDYQIPYAGLYSLVSCPNFFGEIVEWLGFTLACGLSKSSFAFFVYTCANLIPRALAHHQWYFDRFGERYPRNRKAVIPYIL